ncbi:MAG: hypothetical protein K5679_02125 [Lachnospiraceae bacterium]|nr:hypothetical protein [Lachnospiraceae bacterium]
MDKSSKLITYILLAVCVALPFLIGLLARLIADASADRNGHGIDGIGAALMTGVFIKIMAIAGYVAYLVLWVYSTVRVFRLSMPKWVIVLPLIPIVLYVVLNKVQAAKVDKAREAYTAETYIEEVLPKKESYQHVTSDGAIAIYAYDYIITEVVSDLWPQKYRYNMDWQARKAIADAAIPELMKNLESEPLCYTKMWTPDGKPDGKYYKTTMEYWTYDPATDTLTVKFSHKAEADVFVNRWADKE